MPSKESVKYGRSKEFWDRIARNAFLVSAYRQVVTDAWEAMHAARRQQATPSVLTGDFATRYYWRASEQRAERELRTLLRVRKMARRDGESGGIAAE